MSNDIAIPTKHTVGKPHVFTLIQKRHEKSTGIENIPVVDVINDPKNKDKERRIQYVPGEVSIYADEQREDAENRLGEIVVLEGIMIVEKQDRLKLDYLMACNYNASNPNRKTNAAAIFREDKPAKSSAERMDAQAEQDDARALVRQMNMGEILPIAKVLGINTNRSEEEIRYDVMIVAGNGPREFRNMMKDPVTRRKAEILEAIDKGVVHFDRVSNTISWPKGGTIFNGVPGQNVVDALVKHTISSDDGQKIFQVIHQELQPMEQPVDPNDIKDRIEEENKASNGDNEDYIENLYKSAYDKGIIKFVGRSYRVDGKDTEIKGRENMIEALKGDLKLRAKVEQKLSS